MKNLKIAVVTVLFLLSIQVQLKAGAEVSIPTTEKVQSVAVNAIIERLEKINAMDKSSLASNEKRALRKEVNGLKSELNRYNSGGVYISVGALIIIILLLIILL